MTTYLATAVASTVSQVPSTARVTVTPVMPSGIEGVEGVGIVPGERVLLPRSVVGTPNAAGEVSFSLIATGDTLANDAGVGVRYRMTWGPGESVVFTMPRSALRVSSQPTGTTPADN